MPYSQAVESRVLLKRLRDTLAEAGAGQERLDRITQLVSSSLAAEVCSIYLRLPDDTLELCATTGLNPVAVHQTRMRVREGLVGRIADTAEPVNTDNAPQTRGFQYFPETGEEIFASFLGVPIQRLGEVLGVLVIQNQNPRVYTEDEVHGLEVVAMVIAEMAELGAFTGTSPTDPPAPHRGPFHTRGLIGQEGVAEGTVLLHDPQVVIANPVADDPTAEHARLSDALERLRSEVDEMLAADNLMSDGEHREVLNAWRMFAHDKGWVRRMEASIDAGLAAEVAVEREQSETRTRMARVADPYLRERLHDLDDLSNRLLRLLAGRDGISQDDMPPDAILVARNIGPGELLDYGRRLKGVVLEEGSVGSHAAIVARALAIPLVIQAERITREAMNGDRILVDGDQGVVHLRPEENVAEAFRAKVEMLAAAQEAYAGLRDMPAETRDGTRISLCMNAGLMADLPSLKPSGAEGVGLYRTELAFLVRRTVPRRGELVALYRRIIDAAGDLPVTFRTLDIGSDKVLPYMKRPEEPNPALGWRAIRVGLDRPGVMRMQVQAILRATESRPLRIMFPFVAQFDEFRAAREIVLAEVEREKRLGRRTPSEVKIGAMLETPSLAFAPDHFFKLTDFISIGGNDLKMFFFAADRENEMVRRRYDTLNVSFLSFLEQIVRRCEANGTPVSFCGEDAGRPVEALAFAAMGLRNLSMRPSSIGPVKRLIRAVDLGQARAVIDEARGSGVMSVREALSGWLKDTGAPGF
ncbi:phosphoenolpyruvate--protein phosphotransferase [Halovulum dunhuangense]|uniref:phosphoenolpyruvate--protein phosphotransferase n=1 Tax=Halovulum dunhuangense TaxID=1505036 RepID=A0A849L0F5_9RHOB|nr:phosphoenolpyruvate--protein phosphotransferase [Halovulum dunhuangense]NNU79740.1 phosphoenolpyruvate--protein phosphotransferase [Halovulum dunhuangense]